ncbi:MAG: hypothetical protein GXO87_02220 [Chlorobi bacterium]|nr:hypothetical protein [Chlorobiota bacterium]
MEQITLVAHVKKDQISKIEAVLRVLKFSISNLNLRDISFKEIADKTILTLSFNEKYHDKVIERFALNKIDIIPPDEKSKEIIEQAKKKLKRKDTAFTGWGGGTLKKMKPIEEIIKDGDYGDLILISRDVSKSKFDKAKAQANIDKAVSNAIKIAYSLGLKENLHLESSIDRLIEIASDRTLRTYQKFDFMKEAGEMAIKLISTSKEMYAKLIKLAGKKFALDSVIVKAAATFYDLVLDEKYPDSHLVNIALKSTNLTWLKTTYRSAKNKITPAVKLSFENFYKYVKKNK